MSVTPINHAARTAPVAATPLHAKPTESPKPPVLAKASQPLNLSGTAVAARALAASPPVDAVKVADLKARIADGTYKIDALAIADKMIALDLP